MSPTMERDNTNVILMSNQVENLNRILSVENASIDRITFRIDHTLYKK